LIIIVVGGGVIPIRAAKNAKIKDKDATIMPALMDLPFVVEWQSKPIM
jgi:hypothetical protein